MPPIRLVLVTGLSGSGKSTVANCFEDLSYYCVDNLPLPLLRRLLAELPSQIPGHEAVAVVTDVRAPGFATEFPRLARDIDRSEVDTTLLFLEASDEALLRRFSETRRPHPLAGDGQVTEGIRRERELLADLRAQADVVIDSTALSTHEMREAIYRLFAAGPRHLPQTIASLVSFGFKHGVPHGADLVFDVRFLPNPYFVDDLRPLSGRDPEVVEFLGAEREFDELRDRIERFLLYLRPKYERENRSYLTVAIGCTGGRHRSVAMVEELGRRLREHDWPVKIHHRDIHRAKAAAPEREADDGQDSDPDPR